MVYMFGWQLVRWRCFNFFLVPISCISFSKAKSNHVYEIDGSLTLEKLDNGLSTKLLSHLGGHSCRCQNKISSLMSCILNPFHTSFLHYLSIKIYLLLLLHRVNA